ncbi:MAG TPA: PIG-L family deacetylase [Propionibacterium sp.]|jgi:LmbE family N-acetylglucosaminyl deacetylase|nr:PIG-L family deacetylase [Propionibacterium sp.]
MGQKQLPEWSHLLAVVAHPDDESFGLGALIDAFARRGAAVDVLCLTQGEASTVGAADNLAEIRALELRNAARALGVANTVLGRHPDGRLGDVDPAVLAGEVRAAAESSRAAGMLVFDTTGISGHPDHMAATAAAERAADALGLPVLAWTLEEAVAAQLRDETGAPFVGRPDRHVDLTIKVDRTTQHAAIACHASQAEPGSVLWRRLELQGDREVLRWLRPPVSPEGDR